MKIKSKTLLMGLGAAALFSVSVLGQAEGLQLQAKKVQPKPVITAVTVAKPATCAPGFVAIDKKLVSHEGKKWYEYSCVQQKVINRTCNADTSVIDVDDKFVSMPSDGKSKKSKLYMSYKCFNYVPVE